MGNMKLLFEEGQATQWLSENVQRDKQWSTKQYILSNTNPTKNRSEHKMLKKR